jgi:hypothetical protein
LELGRDILQLKILFVKLFVAVFAKPHKSIELARMAFSFDHQAHGICPTDRIMGNARWQQEHLALADRDLDGFAIFLDLDLDVPLELVKKLFALIPMIVLARIRAADHHHDEIVIVKDALIPNRRPQEMPVFIDPLFKIEWSSDHGPTTFSPLVYAH